MMEVTQIQKHTALKQQSNSSCGLQGKIIAFVKKSLVLFTIRYPSGRTVWQQQWK